MVGAIVAVGDGVCDNVMAAVGVDVFDGVVITAVVAVSVGIKKGFNTEQPVRLMVFKTIINKTINL